MRSKTRSPETAERRWRVVTNLTASSRSSSQVEARIGRFVRLFSVIEKWLSLILATALKLPLSLVDPVTAPYDFRALCDVALAAYRFRCTDPATAAKFEDPTRAKTFEKLVKRCKRVNED